MSGSILPLTMGLPQILENTTPPPILKASQQGSIDKRGKFLFALDGFPEISLTGVFKKPLISSLWISTKICLNNQEKTLWILKKSLSPFASSRLKVERIYSRFIPLMASLLQEIAKQCSRETLDISSLKKVLFLARTLHQSPSFHLVSGDIPRPLFVGKDRAFLIFNRREDKVWRYTAFTTITPALCLKTARMFDLHSPKETLNEEERKTLQTEIERMKELKNRLGFVRLHTAFQDQQTVRFMTSHFSTTLLSLFQDRKPLSFEKKMDLALSLVEILRELHEQGITHSNLRPGFVFLDPSGDLRLGGLGLSRKKNEPAKHTCLEDSKYTAPERSSSSEDPDLWENSADPASDVYSLGKIFQRLFRGSSKELMQKSLPEQGSLEQLIHQMLSPFPGERPMIGAVYGCLLQRAREPISDFLKRFQDFDPQKKERSSLKVARSLSHHLQALHRVDSSHEPLAEENIWISPSGTNFVLFSPNEEAASQTSDLHLLGTILQQLFKNSSPEILSFLEKINSDSPPKAEEVYQFFVKYQPKR